MKEADDIVRNFKTTLGTMRREQSEITAAFLNLLREAREEGELSPKLKELILLGISICISCDTCIVLHTREALRKGATRKELMETCAVALTMRGSSVIGNISKVLQAFNAFSRERK